MFSSVTKSGKIIEVNQLLVFESCTGEFYLSSVTRSLSLNTLSHARLEKDKFLSSHYLYCREYLEADVRCYTLLRLENIRFHTDVSLQSNPKFSRSLQILVSR